MMLSDIITFVELFTMCQALFQGFACSNSMIFTTTHEADTTIVPRVVTCIPLTSDRAGFKPRSIDFRATMAPNHTILRSARVCLGPQDKPFSPAILLQDLKRGTRWRWGHSCMGHTIPWKSLHVLLLGRHSILCRQQRP